MPLDTFLDQTVLNSRNKPSCGEVLNHAKESMTEASREKRKKKAARSYFKGFEKQKVRLRFNFAREKLDLQHSPEGIRRYLDWGHELGHKVRCSLAYSLSELVLRRVCPHIQSIVLLSSMHVLIIEISSIRC